MNEEYTMKKWLLLLFICWFALSMPLAQKAIWEAKVAQIDFRSDAPLELIEASSNELRGVIDPEEHTFAFVVNINSFEGFNSPLQQQHFNENYLESTRYPKATFKGRIIDKCNFDEPGEFTIRAKGYLNIHGVEQERIIKSEVVNENGVLHIKSYFSVRLDDHNITIPHIVNQKIAENIEISVSAAFRKTIKNE
jgi:hypothetical protein